MGYSVGPATLKATVRFILERAPHYDWTLQGLGMLRLGLPGNRRLHVWDAEYATKTGASAMHTHPWAFTSLVVAGRIKNRRFVEDVQGDVYWRQQVKCGPGGGLEGEPSTAFLRGLEPTWYWAGDQYSQRADEIHVSEPLDGTVTILTRIPGTSPDHAYLFWPVDKTWVSAEARRATAKEVQYITERALELWFGSSE